MRAARQQPERRGEMRRMGPFPFRQAVIDQPAPDCFDLAVIGKKLMRRHGGFWRLQGLKESTSFELEKQKNFQRCRGCARRLEAKG
jgi:hypothetical protein